MQRTGNQMTWKRNIMKATLEFDLSNPVDQLLHTETLNAHNYKDFIDNFWQDILRPMQKHEIPENLQDAHKLLSHICVQWRTYLQEYEIK